MTTYGIYHIQRYRKEKKTNKTKVKQTKQKLSYENVFLVKKLWAHFSGSYNDGKSKRMLGIGTSVIDIIEVKYFRWLVMYKGCRIINSPMMIERNLRKENWEDENYDRN